MSMDVHIHIGAICHFMLEDMTKFVVGTSPKGPRRHITNVALVAFLIITNLQRIKAASPQFNLYMHL